MSSLKTPGDVNQLGYKDSLLFEFVLSWGEMSKGYFGLIRKIKIKIVKCLFSTYKKFGQTLAPTANKLKSYFSQYTKW